MAVITLTNFVDGSSAVPINGTASNDQIFAFLGDDVVDGLNGSDVIFGGNGSDTLSGGNGDDFLVGENGSDALNGQSGNDTLLGGNQDDILNGGNNNDLLVGENGNDSLNGGFGNDVLAGGSGRDTLTGADGSDTFIFSLPEDSPNLPVGGRDTITDFEGLLGDVIDLSGIDANITVANDQSFLFARYTEDAGGPPPIWPAQSLHVDVLSDVVYGNVDNDITPEFAIKLPGVTMGNINFFDFIA